MSLAITEHIFNGPTSNVYDHLKTTLGPHIVQMSGNKPTDRFAGPRPNAFARVYEAVGALMGYMICGYSYSPDVNHIYVLQNITSGSTRRIWSWEHTLSTNEIILKGDVTVNLPFSSTTNRSFDIARSIYTTGQASVSGTTVTGVDTLWQSARIARGKTRIGFGSNNPTEITDWYFIDSIDSETSITLNRSCNELSSVPYVIDEVRFLITLTHATPSNGGLYLVKGLSQSAFYGTVSNIPVASNMDNDMATYWITDDSTVTSTTPYGIAVLTKSSDTMHEVIVQNGVNAIQFYRFNIRADLSGLTSGTSTAAFLGKTGSVGIPSSNALQGSVAVQRSCEVATLSHGPGAGVKSIFVSTTNMLIRCPVNKIVNGATNFIDESMIETPPGGSVTYRPSGAAYSSVSYIPAIDRLFIAGSTSSGYRSYVTKFNYLANQMEFPIIANLWRGERSGIGDRSAKIPNAYSSNFATACINNVLYMLRINSTFGNTLFGVSISTDWNLASTTGSTLITPALSTKGAIRLKSIYTNFVRTEGELEGIERYDAFRTYARTSGIENNTGSWTLLDESGDLSSLVLTDKIQLMYDFKLYGLFIMPARILSCIVTYEDCVNDEHFKSSKISNYNTGEFCWFFAKKFFSSVPHLKVFIVDIDSGQILVSSDTEHDYDDFSKSTNGGNTWLAFDNSDVDNQTTYIKFNTNYIFNGQRIKAVLVKK